MNTALARFAEQLAAFDARLSDAHRAELATLAHGRSFSELIVALRAAADPAEIQAAAELLAANESGCACSGDTPPEPSHTQQTDAAETLARSALAPFVNNAALRARLTELHAPIAPHGFQ